MRLIWFAVLAISFCISCGGPTHPDANLDLRTALANIKASDIQEVEFRGPYLSLKDKDGGSGDPNFERDQKKITKILAAFQHAVAKPGTNGPAGLTDSVIFHYSASLNKESLTITVNGAQTDDDFGKDVKDIFEAYRQRPQSEYNGDGKSGR